MNRVLYLIAIKPNEINVIRTLHCSCRLLNQLRLNWWALNRNSLDLLAHSGIHDALCDLIHDRLCHQRRARGASLLLVGEAVGSKQRQAGRISTPIATLGDYLAVWERDVLIFTGSLEAFYGVVYGQSSRASDYGFKGR